jgi:hypothetical protein
MDSAGRNNKMKGKQLAEIKPLWLPKTKKYTSKITPDKIALWLAQEEKKY